MILIAHFLRLLFALISSPQANDHAIPSPTTASTPRRSTILMTNRINCAKIDWNPAIHVGTLHSYLRCGTGPVHATPLSHLISEFLFPLSSFGVVGLITHTQFPPGTISDVYTFWSSAYPVCHTSPDEMRASMSMISFCIDFRVGMWRYQSWNWVLRGVWWERYPYWWV